MWTRYELKQRAKANLFSDGWRPFWSGVLVLLVYAAIFGGVSAIVSAPLNAPSALKQVLASVQAAMNGEPAPAAQGAAPALQVVNYVLSLAVSAFVAMPLMVGVRRYFLRIRQRAGRFEDLFYAFEQRRYLPVLASVAWWLLFLTLWQLLRDAPDFLLKSTVFANTQDNIALTLLLGLWNLCALALWIPFIIKSIAYSMTGYILCDNPNIGYRRALRLSQAMTAGQKGQIFVLYLSFIGWFLLGVLCLVVGLLGAAAYFEATQAELYARLRDRALRAGVCSYEELHFLPPEQ